MYYVLCTVDNEACSCMKPVPVRHCSSLQVSVSGMQIMEVIVASLKAGFRPYIPTSKLELQHSLKFNVGRQYCVDVL